MAMTAHLRNTWYVAGFADEFGSGAAVARTQSEPRERGIDALNLHLATPETATTCHYWFWTTRNFAIDPHANVQIRAFIEHAFTQQDKPMLEAQQRRIGETEFWSLQPVLLAGDAGAVRVRRKLQHLMAVQAG